MRGKTYGLGADVGVPYLGVELDDGRLERVAVWDLDIDRVLAASVGGVGGRGEGALQVQQIVLLNRLGEDARVVLVAPDVVQLLEDSPLLWARHGGWLGCLMMEWVV